MGKITKEKYVDIINMHNDGMSNKEIAKLYDVSTSRIGQILRENGLYATKGIYTKFSEEDCSRIVRLYKSGVSSVEIAKLFNCSYTPIKKILKLNGITLDTTLRKIPKDDWQNVVDMYNDGMSQRDIAEIYGCSSIPVGNILRQMNVEMHPNGFTSEDAEQMYELYKSGKRIPEIAEIYHTDRHTVGRVFKRNGFETNRKTYHCDEHYFDVIDTQDKAYIAGLLWSDGCNQLHRGTITLQLQERDSYILEEIKSVSKNERPLYKINLNDKNPNWQNSITLTWQSKHMSQMLNDYGMVPRKSLVLKFPSWLDESLYPSFLRGYVDGDGSIYCSCERNVFRISMVGTKMFLDVVKKVCDKIGVKTNFSHKEEHSDVTYVLFTTSNSGSLKLANWMYDNANLKLQRKFDKYQQFLQYKNINNSLVS